MSSQIRKLCEEFTDLSKEDMELLEGIESSLQYHANLTGACLFIDCKMINSPHAIVVAEAFPNRPQNLYTNQVVGKIVFESFEPAVLYSLQLGKRSEISKAVNQEGLFVEQHVEPIVNQNGHVIAVLIQEKEIPTDVYVNQSIKEKMLSLNMAKDYELERNVPIVTDLLMEILVITDTNHHILYTNAAGYKFISEISNQEDIQKKPILELVPQLQEIYMQHDDVFVVEMTTKQKTFLVKKIRIRNQNVKETLLIIQDLTELRTKEHQLRMKTYAIREIHHRVKNNLQTVTSLLRLQMRNDMPESSIPFFEEALNRIYSISAVYELILEKENAEEDEVNLIELIQKVCSKLQMNQLGTNVQITLHTDCQSIIVKSKKAVSISLIICELVQNAFKHAFYQMDSGLIDVTFYKLEGKIALQISDNGVGLKKGKSSLGMEIVENLVAYDLNGEFKYLPVEMGTAAYITFPFYEEVVTMYEA